MAGLKLRESGRFWVSIRTLPVFNGLVSARRPHQPTGELSRLAERLQGDGVKVWLDAWVLQPGAPISLEIQRGLEQSRILVMCMSQGYFASEWTTLEHHTLLFRDPTNQQRRLIPVLLEAGKRPDVIAQFLHIDWRERRDVDYQKLLASCGRFTELKAPTKDSDKNMRSSGTTQDLVGVLQGHNEGVWGVAIDPDGRRAVSCSSDKTRKIWDLDKHSLIATLEGHSSTVRSVAISPDGRRAVSCGDDETPKMWDLDKHSLIATLEGHTGVVWGVAITPDGRRAVSGSSDTTLKVWDLNKQCLVATLEGHTAGVVCVAISLDGHRVVSGSSDETLKIWDLDKHSLIATLEGHTGIIWGVAITPDGRRAVSGSQDQTLKIWGLDEQRLVATLEGHTGPAKCVSISSDGRRAFSGAWEDALAVWDLDEQRLIAKLEGHTDSILGVAISPDGRRAVSGSDDRTLRIWDLTAFDTATFAVDTARYTNAKVVLVGESGVGKSGLALRLADDDWHETGSTHGMTVSNLDLPSAGDSTIEREVWLWDFAGQPDYRLIHQLYMDDTALALMVIDPQKDQPFAPLAHWEKALAGAVKHDPAKLLVAARCDRGGYIVGQRDIDHYVADRDYAGHVNTSAKLPNDPGCAELRHLIDEHIPWDRLPSTSTTKLFKALKDAVIEIRDAAIVLIRVVELEQRLRLNWTGDAFEARDLRTVISLLAGQGIVQPLDFGDFVLLQPEQINNYGSAVVRAARDCESELAELLERAVLDGDIDFKDMERLGEADEKILLRAMLQTFLDLGLCYRIRPEGGDRLVFPAYFKHDRPDVPEQPAVVVRYGFTGPVDQIYTTLVVRLHYTHDFEIDRLWRYAGDFKSFSAGRAGLMLAKERDEAATIKVYFDDACAIDSRVSFIKYIHEHLKREASDVERIRDYVCPHCNAPVENKQAVANKLKAGKKDIICVECEERVPLIDLIEEKFASDELSRNVRAMDQQAQFRLDNESLELILVGHAFSTVGEAGHIFRPTANSDWGIDGEIEFKNDQGQASGQRLYLQLKSGESYLRRRKHDDAEIFEIKNPRHADYWQAHEYPVMLVIRGADETIRWMDVTDYLKRHGTRTKRIVFEGEPFTAINVRSKWLELTGDPLLA